MGKPTLMKSRNENSVIPELRYERLIQNVCGDNWRETNRYEVDGALGVAIVKSIVDGVDVDIEEIAYHLNIPKYLLTRAFNNFILAGVFQCRTQKDGKIKNRIDLDQRELNSRDVKVWCWYAGCASGFVR